MRPRAVLVVLALVGLLPACAPKSTAPPVAGAARYPDFVQPTVPTELAAPAQVQQNSRAWAYLQVGDLRTADREVAALLKRQPGFYPAETTSAYVALARKDAKAAASQFDRIVRAHPDYLPALVGHGLALEAAEDTAGAVEAYRAALAVDDSLSELARRIDVLTLRGLQEELSRARDAAKAGDSAAATRAYRNAIAASPDSPFLYRELAAVERRAGERTSAIEHLTRAHDLDPADAPTLVLLGDLLEEAGQPDRALKAYADALAIDQDAATEAKRAALQARMDLAALPEQYRAIENSAQATRAELAALIGVRLAGLVQAAPVRDIGVLTDIRGNWAERWIAPVARAGIVEALPNHTFQPRGVVRRVELAQTIGRLLNLVAAVQPERGRAWTGARGRFTDLTPGHLAYPAASMAVAAGVLGPADGGAFQPTRVVTGAEAIEAIDRVRRLASEPGRGASNRR